MTQGNGHPTAKTIHPGRAGSAPERRSSGVRAKVDWRPRKRRRRRRHERVPVDQPVLIVVEGVSARGRCTNLSLGGMAIESDLRPAVGMRVQIWLSLDEQDLLIGGTVRWTTAAGVGIQLDLLSAPDTYVLSELLVQRQHA